MRLHWILPCWCCPSSPTPGCYGPMSSRTKEAAKVCPVTGHPIDLKVSIDYKGARLYFHSPASIDTFQADPAKYAVGANYQLAVTGQAKQVACPFTGRPLSPSIPSIKVGVLDIGFCCRACEQTVATADYQTRFELVFGDHFSTGFAIVKK